MFMDIEKGFVKKLLRFLSYKKLEKGIRGKKGNFRSKRGVIPLVTPLPSIVMSSTQERKSRIRKNGVDIRTS